MTDEEEYEEVDDFDLFIEEKNNRIKELENDRHELLEKIKAIKEVLNIEEVYRLKKENEDLKAKIHDLEKSRFIVDMTEIENFEKKNNVKSRLLNLGSNIGNVSLQYINILEKENADLIDKLNIQNQRLNELKNENEELKTESKGVDEKMTDEEIKELSDKYLDELEDKGVDLDDWSIEEAFINGGKFINDKLKEEYEKLKSEIADLFKD